MGILWTFMGASTAYTKFCGLVEVSAGLLLLFRRTTTVGALVAAGAMLNVMLLNFCYDVPVKLYSAHILLMSLFLLIPNARALIRLFFLQQPANLEGVWVPRFERRWLRIAAAVLQVLVVASVLYNNVWGGYQNVKKYSTTYFKHAPIYGLWNIDSFTADGSHPAAVSEGAHWSQLAIQRTAGFMFAMPSVTGSGSKRHTTSRSAF